MQYLVGALKRVSDICYTIFIKQIKLYSETFRIQRNEQTHSMFIPFQDRERSSAFKAVGLIAIAVRQDIESYSRQQVFEQVKVSLPMKDSGHK